MNNRLPQSSFPLSTFHTAGPKDKKPNGEPLFERVPQKNPHLEIKIDENENIHMSILGTSSNDGMEIEVGLINLTHMQTFGGTNPGDIEEPRIKCIWGSQKPTVFLVFSQDPTPDPISLSLHRWQMKLKDFEALAQLQQTLEAILNSAKIMQPSGSTITHSNDPTSSHPPQSSSSQTEPTLHTSPYDLLWPHMEDLKSTQELYTNWLTPRNSLIQWICQIGATFLKEIWDEHCMPQEALSNGQFEIMERNQSEGGS